MNSMSISVPQEPSTSSMTTALAHHIIIYMVKATMVVTLPLTPTCLWVTLRLLSIACMDTPIMGTLQYPNDADNKSYK